MFSAREAHINGHIERTVIADEDGGGAINQNGVLLLYLKVADATFG